MSEKKPYYEFSDGHDVEKIVMDLSGVICWIETDAADMSKEDFAEMEYTITPVYMTDEEYKNLPEADI